MAMGAEGSVLIPRRKLAGVKGLGGYLPVVQDFADKPAG
jgi:hypothetical protein